MERKDGEIGAAEAGGAEEGQGVWERVARWAGERVGWGRERDEEELRELGNQLISLLS